MEVKACRQWVGKHRRQQEKPRNSCGIRAATRLANELPKLTDKETKAEVELGARCQLLAFPTPSFPSNLRLKKDSK